MLFLTSYTNSPRCVPYPTCPAPHTTLQARVAMRSAASRKPDWAASPDDAEVAPPNSVFVSRASLAPIDASPFRQGPAEDWRADLKELTSALQPDTMVCRRAGDCCFVPHVAPHHSSSSRGGRRKRGLRWTMHRPLWQHPILMMTTVWSCVSVPTSWVLQARVQAPSMPLDTAFKSLWTSSGAWPQLQGSRYMIHVTASMHAISS